jgi:DNA-binding transcriptional ArsR family regulator
MRPLVHPDLDSVDLLTVLHALSDTVRLEVVLILAESDGVRCGEFDVPVSMSTLSHHVKVLRQAGVVRVTPQGNVRRHELRLDELEARWPGVMSSIIAGAQADRAGATPASATA